MLKNIDEIRELPIIIGNYVNTLISKKMTVYEIYQEISAFAGQKRDGDGLTATWEILRGYGISIKNCFFFYFCRYPPPPKKKGTQELSTRFLLKKIQIFNLCQLNMIYQCIFFC